MLPIRNAKRFARFVLVWFALSIGVAVASPMVQPEEMQLVCSGAGAMKVVVTGEDGAQSTISHTLDCPLCASISGLPPLDTVTMSNAAPRTFGTPDAGFEPLLFVSAAPPPARGPPPALS
jgi:hypothetical protein